MPVCVDFSLDGGVVVYAQERDAILALVQAVATHVAPTVIANVGRAVHEYHESAGTSSAIGLDLALSDVPDRLPIALVTLSPQEALALAEQLREFALTAMSGGAA